ncbi:hypothetical protein M569_00995, partial [Genlisea aurea]
RGLCYVGRIDDAKNMMRRIAANSRDIHTYNAVMNGLCKVGRTVEALALMDEALEMGLSPNVITYNTLFNGFFKQGRPLLGSGLLKRMDEGDHRLQTGSHQLQHSDSRFAEMGQTTGCLPTVSRKKWSKTDSN